MGLIGSIGRLFRTSIENPRTTLREAADWLFDAWGGGTTIAGVRVNRKAALGYSPVWRAVNLIAGDVGKLPLRVMKRRGSGWERDVSHPAWYLLHLEANSQTSALDLKRVLTGHALLHGNGYAFIDRRGSGVPERLLILNPEHCWPIRVDGQLKYAYDAPTSSRDGAAREMRILDATNVLHIKGLGFDGMLGYSVLELARQSLGMGIAARDYGAKFFSAGGRPSAVIEHPGVMKPEVATRLRESWERQYSGVENAHKTAILEEGMKLHVFGIPAKDAQLIESRQFEIREVANFFGVPPHKLGDTTRTAYASLEQENQAYLDGALDVWLVTWETECRIKLLAEDEKRGATHTVEFLREALVRANLNDRANYYRQATGGAPWMTVNEVRHAESMNELNSEIADELILPLNMRPESEAAASTPGPAGPGAGGGDTPAPAAPGNKPAESDAARAARELTRSRAHRAMLIDAAGRMARRLGTQARAASSKPAAFGAFMQELDPKNRDTVTEALTGPLLAICCDEARAREEAVTAAALLFEQVRSGLAPVYAHETKSNLPAAVERAAAVFEKSFPLDVAKRFAGGTDADPDS